MPHFRDLFPHFGAVGEKRIVNQIKDLYLTDCLFILSKLSRHWVKYHLLADDQVAAEDVYRSRCLELLSPSVQGVLLAKERSIGKKYDVIFPELSVAHLIKICLKNCKSGFYTKEEDFPARTAQSLGESLLITNAILADNQVSLSSNGEPNFNQMVVNFTKQLIADENFYVMQKLYQNHFLFNEYLLNHKNIFDAQEAFTKKYGLGIKEYFAFLFAMYSQFVIKNTENEDYEMPYFDINIGLANLKPKFKKHLVDNLLINKISFKKIDHGFFNVTDLQRRPLVELESGVVIPLSMRRFLMGITDSIYFDLAESLPTDESRKLLSNAYGKAIEDYFFDIVKNIDKDAMSEFEYKDGKQIKKTPDAISLAKGSVIFFECKKRQFHNLEFLKNGNIGLFNERIKEFFYTPLKQLCDRILDFRTGKFVLPGIRKDSYIYPVIVCPMGPPIFSGGWDKLKLNERVLPDLYKTDKNIAQPEFLDFAELECIEAYLTKNPDVSFIDLIKIKRADKSYHNANWMVVLHKNGFNYKNIRLQDRYMESIGNFKKLLFEQV